MMELVKTQNRDGIFLIHLQAPPANCYTHEMMKQLDAAILAARFDNRAHVIVITGAGEKFFCGGADIGMLHGVDPDFKYQFCLHSNETLLRLEHTPKLVIAAINGHCVGGGLEIALACDLRIARKNAGKFGLPEVKLGVLPGTGGTARLSRVVGKGKSIELMASGRLFGDDEAMKLGLVNQVFDAASNDQFMTQVMDYAKTFCPPRAAAMAVAHIKRSVQTGIEMSLSDHLALERELQQRLFTSQDAKEGIAAYVEKREAKFCGY